MQNLFNPTAINELKTRIHSLESTTRPTWGKMTAAQMLAHCSEVMRNALGETQQERQWIGYFIAPFIRHRYYDDVPYQKKGVPSSFTIEDQTIFCPKRID